MKAMLGSALRRVGRVGRSSGRQVSALVRRVLDRGRAADAAARLAAAVPVRWHARPIDPAARARLQADAGRTIAGTWTGSRSFRLYVASGAARRRDGPPLVVMLHGCKQNPDDFAAGTRMDERAEDGGWLVLYPGQPKKANRSCCWNWWRSANQRRDGGEPALIAALTRQVVDDYGVDPRRVHVAGLSAGGAMAATMAATHPDLYASCGVHSGLPHGAARNLVAALHVMRHGGGSPPPATVAAIGAVHAVVGRVLGDAASRAPMPAPADGAAGGTATAEAASRAVPMIVFHGDHDTVVHPCNADQVVARAQPGGEGDVEARFGSAEAAATAQQSGGHAYTRTVHRDADGAVVAEHWLVHGAGHAWSGGSAAGSYADPRGPDASAEMLRFFTEHPQPRTAARR